MAPRVISQRKVVRGLNATCPSVSQVPGSLPRLSNMLFTVRGGLRTCDGTLILSRKGAIAITRDPILEVFYYQPSGGTAKYIGITKDVTTQLSAPAAPTLTAKNIVGTLAAAPTGAVRVTGVVTITTTGAHGMDSTYVGMTNEINSCPDTTFNGNWVITSVPSATTFTYNDPTNADATSGTGFTGGVLSPATTYSYRITALDGAGGETTLGTATAAALAAANTTNKITWPAVTYATGYNVYGRTAGAEKLLLDGTNTQTISGAPTSPTYYDLGVVTPATYLAPTVNNTQVATVVDFNVPTTTAGLPGVWGSSNIIKTLPADLPPFDYGGGGGGTGGGGGSGTGGLTPGASGTGTSVGGIQGNISPIPQIIQFTNKMILALGNGLTPYLSDGTPAGTVQLTNTFVPSYPIWIASTAYNVGDVITPTAANGHLYKCVTAGSTGAAQPTWPTTTDKTVSNGSTIWKEAGSDTATNPPAGAAHAIAHAGSLWVFNTSSTNTSDGLDGPSALRMSDVNNPKSWNPLNAAFVGKDDGSQGMGIAAFTIAEAGIPPTGTLVCFKEFSTYQVNGVFGSTSFSIQQVQSDMGCVAPRTIQFLPGFGIARLTHLGVALFDGVRDRVISEEIRPYLFGGQADIDPLDWNYAWLSKGCQVANPPMYCIAIPTQRGKAIGTLNPIVTAITTGAGADTWRVQVSAITATGEVAVTSIITVSNAVSFQVTGLTDIVTTGYLKFRVYYTQNVAPTGTSLTGANFFDVPLGLANAIPANYKVNTAGSSAPVYMLGVLTRVLCYDLVLKAWSVVDLPFPIYSMKQIRAAGTIPITLMGGARDGALRRWQAGEVAWDNGALFEGAATTAVNYSFRTPEVFNANPTDRVYFRRLLIRGVVNNGTSGTSASLSVKVTVDGNDQPTIVSKEIDLGSGQFEAAVDIGVSGLNANATISGSGLVEIDSVDWHAVPKPAGALQSIQ